MKGFRVDLSDLAQVKAIARAMETAGIAVDVLINNAGIVVSKAFVDHAPADITRTMDIKVLAPCV